MIEDFLLCFESEVDDASITFHSSLHTWCLNTCCSVFLALKKVVVRQYEDSDSKPGVGVSTQARLPAKGRRRQSRGSGGGVRLLVRMPVSQKAR